MLINLKRSTNKLEVVIGGEVDLSVTTSLKNAIEKELANGCVRNIVFNMKNVQFIDSSGLGVILAYYKKMQEIGGLVSISKANEKLYPVLELSGLPKIMAVNREQIKNVKEEK